MKISLSAFSVNSWFGIVGAFLGWFLGGFDDLLYVLLIFMAVDYLTGVLCAISERKLSSEIGFKGIMRKVLILVLVGIAHALDVYLLKNGSTIRTATIFFYVSNEGISLLENASRLGLPVPEKLKDVLKQLHNKNDDQNKKKPLLQKGLCTKNIFTHYMIVRLL